jgi:hypothetical protein
VASPWVWRLGRPATAAKGSVDSSELSAAARIPRAGAAVDPPARDRSQGDAQPERILTGIRPEVMFAISPERGPLLIGKRFDLAGRARCCVLSDLVTAPLGINPRDPQAIQELPWRSDSVRRTFAPRYLHAFGLRAVALRRAGRVAEADGTMILEGGAFAFDIAEEASSDLDETVELALVVDPAVGRLLVGWDANVSAENAISVEVPPEDEPWGRDPTRAGKIRGAGSARNRRRRGSSGMRVLRGGYGTRRDADP